MNTELTYLVNLMNDSLSGRVATFASSASAYTDEAVRNAFFEILGEERLSYQSFRNHKNEIYTVMEEVLKTNLPLAWENSAFYNQFVDVRNGAIGERNDFIVEDNAILISAQFAGNHWDTPRQKIAGKKSFSVPVDWEYIHVYQDLERFLTGNNTLAEMMAKIQKGFQNGIDARIFSAFNGMGTYLPDAFKETGSYDRTTMSNLIEKVRTASQKEVIIAGTRNALGYIADGMDSSWVSNSQKEERATKGAVLELTGLGCSAVMIPQTLIRGTYDFKVNNKTLYVLPNDEKFIKLYFEGDVRTRDLTAQDTHDQTFDSQLQVKLGSGIVVSSITGSYTIV